MYEQANPSRLYRGHGMYVLPLKDGEGNLVAAEENKYSIKGISRVKPKEHVEKHKSSEGFFSILWFRD